MFLIGSVRQGYPLSPLLFAIDTHPLLVVLSNHAANGDIVGLHLPSGGQLVAQALADDSFMLNTSLKRKSWKEYIQVGINSYK